VRRILVTSASGPNGDGYPARADTDGELVLPEAAVPFPRGFGFSADGDLYLSSGIGPAGEGDNTHRRLRPARPTARSAARQRRGAEPAGPGDRPGGKFLAVIAELHGLNGQAVVLL
jgi:hypothetical protein